FLTARVADHELDRHAAAAVLKLVLAQDDLVANQVPIFEVGAGLHPCVLLRPLVDARGLDDREAVDDLDVVQRAVGNDPVDLYLPSVRLYVDLRDQEANAVRDQRAVLVALLRRGCLDRKSTRLNSSHVKTSYAVFCLKKKNKGHRPASSGDVSSAGRTGGARRRL